MHASGITSPLRTAARAREILAVFVRYGFEDVVLGLRLDRRLGIGRRFRQEARAEAGVERLPEPVRVRKALESLGPTFIKVGQILSTRPDLIPPEWAKEFRRLQKDIPPAPWEDVRLQLEKEYHHLGGVEALFRHIDPVPMAAASMAQAHPAVLKTGERVVLKVLRPGIERVVSADLEILGLVATFFDRHFRDLGYSPTEVYEQFSRQLRRETDLLREARNTERMRRDFADDPFVFFPRVYWEQTTSRVLALERIDGRQVSDIDPRRDLTDAERIGFVKHAADAVFRQCLEIGFFHADPHPGNIFVFPGERLEEGATAAAGVEAGVGSGVGLGVGLPASGPGRICFIDCGMTGTIDPETQDLLASLVHAVARQDLDAVLDVCVQLADADIAKVYDRGLRAEAWELVQVFGQGTLRDIRLGSLLNDFFDMMRRHRLRVPADLVYLIKALSTIEGVGEQIAPEFDLLGHVAPRVEALVRRRYGYEALKARALRSAENYGRLALDLPAITRDLVRTVQRRQLRLTIDHGGLGEVTDTLDHAATNVSYAVLVGALIIGSSVLVLADSIEGNLGWIAVIAGVIFVFGVLMAVYRALAHFIERRQSAAKRRE